MCYHHSSADAAVRHPYLLRLSNAECEAETYGAYVSDVVLSVIIARSVISAESAWCKNHLLRETIPPAKSAQSAESAWPKPSACVMQKHSQNHPPGKTQNWRYGNGDFGDCSHYCSRVYTTAQQVTHEKCPIRTIGQNKNVRLEQKNVRLEQ